MPHIHTDPGQHDHTISIYIFRTDFDEPKLLLHLHRKVGIYAQFGGHVELDETPWQTVRHELEEETGYKISQLQLLQPTLRLEQISEAVVHPTPVVHATMQYPGSTGHYHTDSTYVFTTEEAPVNRPSDGESTDLLLLTRKEVASHPNIDGVTRDTALFGFDTILSAWQPVSPELFS